MSEHQDGRDRQYRYSNDGAPRRRHTPPYDQRRTSPEQRSGGYRIRGRARAESHGYDRDPGGDIHSRDRRRPAPDYDTRAPAPQYRSSHPERGGSDVSGRDRSRSPWRERSPQYGGRPSREVMLDGIPLDITEEDIASELQKYHDVGEIEDVRVIRDRETRISRGFGFLKFPDVEDARAFVERNYPTIYIYGKEAGKDDTGAAKVRIAYSRERELRGRPNEAEGEWACKICTFINYPGRTACHRCHAPYIDASSFPGMRPTEHRNNGDSDASPDGTPSQFLLLRGLEPGVSEELLARGVTKLYKPSETSTDAPTGKRGNAKLTSTVADANLGAKEGTLRRVLLVRDRNNNESWRYGFAEFASVDDAQAAIQRFHSFEKFTISSKSVLVCYIHAGVFRPVLGADEASARFSFTASMNPALRLQYWDDNAYASELVVSVPEIRSSDAASAQSAVDAAARAAMSEGFVDGGKDAEGKAKKRKAAEVKDQAKPKKTAPVHLQFWSNRHAELHGVKPKEAETDASTDSANDGTAEAGSDTDPAKAHQRSFADMNKKCCYLCSRQFKTEAEVNKHERLSDLHRSNLKNKDLVDKALAKLEKAGFRPDDSIPEYRDRAKERRRAFGPSKVSLPMKKPVPAEEKEDSLRPSMPSKGASLLGKMGWTAGDGLGAEGKGRTAPVQTDLYAAGVGLGAQGGKIGDAVEEGERNTKNDYKGFVERVKDAAKERYNQMS